MVRLVGLDFNPLPLPPLTPTHSSTPLLFSGMSLALMAGIIVAALVGGTAVATGGVYGYRAVKKKEERKREYDLAMASVYQEIEALGPPSDKATTPTPPPTLGLDNETTANNLVPEDIGSPLDEGQGLGPGFRRRRLKLVSNLSVSVGGGEDGEGHSTDSHSQERDLEGSHRRSRSRLNSLSSSSSSSDELMAMSKHTSPSGKHRSPHLPIYLHLPYLSIRLATNHLFTNYLSIPLHLLTLTYH